MQLELGLFRLLQLSRSHVLRYVPRARSPLICFAGERLTPGNLYLSEKNYEQRKRLFKERLDAVYTYISPMSDRSSAQSACRSRRLSAYFGQEQCRPCGICDLCAPEQAGLLF